jgi:hypothetical protein
MDPQTFSEQLFFATTHLSCAGSGKTWTGTGFIYQVDTTGGLVQLIVTNRHVVDGADQVRIRLISSDGHGRPKLGEIREVAADAAFVIENVAFHPDPAIDIAVLPLGPVLEAMASEGWRVYFKSVGHDLAITDEEMAQLDAIEQVMFVGYPAGIFDRAHYTPVLRHGMAATPLQLDYCGKPVFLIDASVFPGSSGSPVFLTPAGIAARRGGGLSIGGRKPVLLGVLAAVHSVRVNAEVTETLTQAIATIDQPVNLGIVYKTVAIDATVAVLLERHGIGRVTSAAA